LSLAISKQNEQRYFKNAHEQRKNKLVYTKTRRIETWQEAKRFKSDFVFLKAKKQTQKTNLRFF
jgi:hypothetical protein